jgi:hypothetical protein
MALPTLCPLTLEVQDGAWLPALLTDLSFLAVGMAAHAVRVVGNAVLDMLLGYLALVVAPVAGIVREAVRVTGAAA